MACTRPSRPPACSRWTPCAPTDEPADEITYGQIATILLRMLGYTSAEVGSAWPMDYTNFADDLGLSEGLSLSSMETVTRGEAAILFYHTMKETVNGAGKAYYQSISGLSSTGEGILLDVNIRYGESDGLLMFYFTGSSSGVEYYAQAPGRRATPQRAVWASCSLTAPARSWAFSRRAAPTPT